MTLLLGSGQLRWIVNRPALQWFGRISYGLYLIHMLGFDIVDHWIIYFRPALYAEIPYRFGLISSRFVLSMTLAVGCAFLSRKYFEEWFLGLKDRLTSYTPASPGEPVMVMSQESAQRTA